MSEIRTIVAGSANAIAKERSAYEIARDGVFDQIELLEKLTTSLVSRLSPVLEGPAPAAPENEIAPTGTPVLNDIYAQTSRLRKLGEVIQYLCDKLVI